MLANNSYLRFELDKDGYVSGNAPVSVKNLTIDSSSFVEVIPDAYLANLGYVRAQLKLITASNTLENLDSAIDAANAVLPERCRLVVEGSDLVLKISSGKGTVVSIR